MLYIYKMRRLEDRSDPFISYVPVDRLDKTYELSDEPTPAKCHVAEAPRHFSGKQHHERNPKTEG